MPIGKGISSSEGKCNSKKERLTLYRDKVKEQDKEVTHRSNLSDSNNEELNSGSINKRKRPLLIGKNLNRQIRE